MKMFALAAAALLAATPALAAPPSPQDAAALTELARKADAAWDAKDAATMAGFMARDANVLLSGMPIIEGQAKIGEWYARAFAGRRAVERHITTLTHMNMLTPDLVMTDGAVVVEAQQPDGGWKPVRRFNNVGMARREAGGWKMTAVRAYIRPTS